MLELVKQLCALSGASGREEDVRSFLRAQAEPFADSIRVDAMGNLIVFKRGAKSTGNKLMLCAHMDEVALMITWIEDDGVLRFDTVGGIDRRVLLGKRVWMGKHQIPGIIGNRPIHLTTAAERKQVPKLEDLFIDIGVNSREEAEKLISLGDIATFDPECVEFGSGMLKAKAIDDRFGCAVMLTLLRETLPLDVTFVFAVQEEVGTRGAFGYAFSVQPEIALVLEGTTASDLPEIPQAQKICKPGLGPVIPYMDSGTIYDRGLFELLRALAVENNIPWQTKHMIAGGTDGMTIQRSRDGVRVAAVSAAVRHIHSPSSVAAISDFARILKLTRAFLQAIAEKE